MLWLSNKGRTDVWELFSDNSYLSAILDRQGLFVAALVDLRAKKAESFSPQLLHGFWSKLKKKIPKIVVMFPTVTTKSSKQEEVVWQQYRLCLAMAEYQILGGKHFLMSGMIWSLKRVQCLQKNITVVGLSCVEKRPSGSFTIWAVYFSHLNLYQSHAGMWFQHNDKSEQFLETAKRFFHPKRHNVANMR